MKDVREELHTLVIVGVGMLSQGFLDALNLLWNCREHSLLQSVELIKAAPRAHLAQSHKDAPHCLHREGEIHSIALAKGAEKSTLYDASKAEEAALICRLLYLWYCKSYERVLKFSFHCFTEPQIIAPYYFTLYCSASKTGKLSPLHNVLFADTINIRCSSSPLSQGGYKNYKTFQKSKLDGQSMITFLHTEQPLR